MPNIKELVEGMSSKKKKPNVVVETEPRAAVFEPPRSPPRVQTPGGYGVGAFVPGPVPNPYFVPGELMPGVDEAMGGGAPQALNYAAGPREKEMLTRDYNILSQYQKYLEDNGVDDEEINEIIKDIVLHQKTAREAEYAKPVELKLEDKNPKGR